MRKQPLIGPPKCRYPINHLTNSCMYQNADSDFFFFIKTYIQSNLSVPHKHMAKHIKYHNYILVSKMQIRLFDFSGNLTKFEGVLATTSLVISSLFLFLALTRLRLLYKSPPTSKLGLQGYLRAVRDLSDQYKAPFITRL